MKNRDLGSSFGQHCNRTIMESYMEVLKSFLTKFICLVICSFQFILKQSKFAILGQLGELCQVLHLHLDLQQIGKRV